MTEMNQQPPSQYQRPEYQHEQPPLQHSQPPPPEVRNKSHKFRNYVVLPLVGLVAFVILVTSLHAGSTPAGDSADPAGSGVAPANRTDP